MDALNSFAMALSLIAAQPQEVTLDITLPLMIKEGPKFEALKKISTDLSEKLEKWSVANALMMLILENKILQNKIIEALNILSQDDLKHVLKDPFGDTRMSLSAKEPLFFGLVQTGQNNVIKSILDKKAIDNIDSIDERNKFNSLMLAVLYGHPTIVDLLLKYGANPNVTFFDRNIDKKAGSVPMEKKADLEELYDLFFASAPKVSDDDKTKIKNLLTEARKIFKE